MNNKISSFIFISAAFLTSCASNNNSNISSDIANPSNFGRKNMEANGGVISSIPELTKQEFDKANEEINSLNNEIHQLQQDLTNMALDEEIKNEKKKQLNEKLSKKDGIEKKTERYRATNLLNWEGGSGRTLGANNHKEIELKIKDGKLVYNLFSLDDKHEVKELFSIPASEIKNRFGDFAKIEKTEKISRDVPSGPGSKVEIIESVKHTLINARNTLNLTYADFGAWQRVSTIEEFKGDKNKIDEMTADGRLSQEGSSVTEITPFYFGVKEKLAKFNPNGIDETKFTGKAIGSLKADGSSLNKLLTGDAEMVVNNATAKANLNLDFKKDNWHRLTFKNVDVSSKNVNWNYNGNNLEVSGESRLGNEYKVDSSKQMNSNIHANIYGKNENTPSEMAGRFKAEFNGGYLEMEGTFGMKK